jgi:4-aminobutyrate aminotransferase/(S)-3-amino-2-methylpropionate transaminase
MGSPYGRWIVVPPVGWLDLLQQTCRRHGALLIFDEIFTGWGRTGTWFACEQDGVVPDILCIGKAMGGGMPISACVASRSIMDAWGTSTGEALHTSTFLGHPLSCTAACAAIDRMVALDVPRRAQEAGQRFRDGLEQLRRLHPEKVLEVRGRGLMLGIQFASPAAGPELARRALSEGLIVLPAGDGSVVELTPPLIIESSEIDWAVEVLGSLVDAL